MPEDIQRKGGLVRKACGLLKALATRTVVFGCDRILYRFEKVPLKKLVNWILVEASAHLRTPKPWGYPTILQVEPTNRCNLRCTLCPVAEGLERPSGSMELDLFKRMIDEAGGYVFLILLWEWGEPFINPRIYEMISYARQRGIKLVTSTNGHLFANKENAEKVVRSGLDTLIFAMDGISQDTYERYRRDGKLETILQGIRNVVERKKALGSQTPLVNLRFIAMKHNEHEIPALRDLAVSLGVDALTIKTLFPGHGCDPRKDRENEFIPGTPAYRRFEYTADFERLRLRRNPCRSLWMAPAVHWNGVMCPCSFDVEEHYPFGDLKSASFKDIWFGETLTGMRRRFRGDWESIPLCSQCSYAYKGGDCSRDTVIEAVFFPESVRP
jgi:radical SAM protein with 4Fe4S-binding SPASM domain